MNKRLAILGIICFIGSQGWAQERPLRPETAELLDVGRVRLGLAVEFLHGQRYTLPGLEGDLTRLGMVEIRVGTGEYAEFELSGVIQDFLSVSRRFPPVIPSDFAGNSTNDFGDLILGTKLKLAGEKGARPSFAFNFAVELPNARNESGLGTDETEFFARLLLTKKLGSARIAGNLGLAILGSAVEPNSQSDMLTYAMAFMLPMHRQVDLEAEVYGRQGPQRIGNESLSQAQLGVKIRAAGLVWEVAGMAGLKQFNPRYGLAVGVTYEFQAFRRNKAPVTIR